MSNYAFIDGQNVNLGIRELGWKLDFKKFRIYLQEKYNVARACYLMDDLQLKLAYKKKRTPEVQNLQGGFSS